MTTTKQAQDALKQLYETIEPRAQEAFNLIENARSNLWRLRQGEEQRWFNYPIEDFEFSFDGLGTKYEICATGTCDRYGNYESHYFMLDNLLDGWDAYRQHLQDKCDAVPETVRQEKESEREAKERKDQAEFARLREKYGV